MVMSGYMGKGTEDSLWGFVLNRVLKGDYEKIQGRR